MVVDIVTITDLLNKLVQQDTELKYYHFGYLDELQQNPENNFNQQAKTGRLFPCLDWIIPEEITHNLSEPELEKIPMYLVFSDLQGYDNKTNQDTRSRIEVWRDLKRTAKRFVLLFERALCELNYGGFDESLIRYELGAFLTKRRQQDVTIKFDLILNSECLDVSGDTVPEVTETCDLENYCFCTQNP